MIAVAVEALHRHFPAVSAPIRILPGDLNGSAADQRSIDLLDLQRRTIQQARTQSLVPMKYDVGMDPNTPLFDRIGEVAVGGSSQPLHCRSPELASS